MCTQFQIPFPNSSFFKNLCVNSQTSGILFSTVLDLEILVLTAVDIVSFILITNIYENRLTS